MLRYEFEVFIKDSLRQLWLEIYAVVALVSYDRHISLLVVKGHLIRLIYE